MMLRSRCCQGMQRGTEAWLDPTDHHISDSVAKLIMLGLGLGFVILTDSERCYKGRIDDRQARGFGAQRCADTA